MTGVTRRPSRRRGVEKISSDMPRKKTSETSPSEPRPRVAVYAPHRGLEIEKKGRGLVLPLSLSLDDRDWQHWRKVKFGFSFGADSPSCGWLGRRAGNYRLIQKEREAARARGNLYVQSHPAAPRRTLKAQLGPDMTSRRIHVLGTGGNQR